MGRDTSTVPPASVIGALEFHTTVLQERLAPRSRSSKPTGRTGGGTISRTSPKEEAEQTRSSNTIRTHAARVPDDVLKEKEREAKATKGKRECATVAICPASIHPSLAYTRYVTQHFAEPNSSGQRCSSCFWDGAIICSEEDIPRHISSTRRHQEGSRESGQSRLKSTVPRSQSCLPSISGKSCQATGLRHRSQSIPQTKLAEAPERLSSKLALQLQLLKDQQKEYGDQLLQAQLELNTALRHLQHLNKQAAEIGAPTSTETGEPTVDSADGDGGRNALEAEAQALVLQVQESLQQSIAAAAEKEEAMEIHSDDAEDRKPKRARCMEPGFPQESLASSSPRP